jgi:hypothetical protein
MTDVRICPIPAVQGAVVARRGLSGQPATAARVTRVSAPTDSVKTHLPLRDTIAGLKLERPLTGALASLRRLALSMDNGEGRT